MSTFELITCQLLCQVVHSSQDEALLSVYSTFGADSKEAAFMAPVERFSDLLYIDHELFWKTQHFRIYELLFSTLLLFPGVHKHIKMSVPAAPSVFCVSLCLPYFLHNGLKRGVGEQVLHRSCYRR